MLVICCYGQYSLLEPARLKAGVSVPGNSIEEETAGLQKLGVVMDACMAGPHESAYLQQAAHITGGQYLRPSKPGALLQYLLVMYLPLKHVACKAAFGVSGGIIIYMASTKYLR